MLPDQLKSELYFLGLKPAGLFETTGLS